MTKINVFKAVLWKNCQRVPINIDEDLSSSMLQSSKNGMIDFFGVDDIDLCMKHKVDKFDIKQTNIVCGHVTGTKKEPIICQSNIEYFKWKNEVNGIIQENYQCPVCGEFYYLSNKEKC